MNFSHHTFFRQKGDQSGFTLAELLVAIGLGSLVLAVVALSMIYGSRSFVAMGNYVELDASSRDALDNLTRQIRQASALQSYATNQLVLTDPAGTLTVAWNPATRQVYTERGGVTTVYLTECDYLRFSIWKRNPIQNTTNRFYPATNSPNVYDEKYCKLIDMSWRCSRSIFGKKVNTESVQTAQIVLRNKKVTP